MQLSFPFEGEHILLKARDRLVGILGPQRDEQRYEPTPQWVKAMISSRTYDAISDEAFARLEGLHLGICWPTWRPPISRRLFMT